MWTLDRAKGDARSSGYGTGGGILLRRAWQAARGKTWGTKERAGQ